MDASYLDNAINHVSTISKENLTEENSLLLDRVWLRLGRIYTKKTQNETSFKNEVRRLLDNCPKPELKEKVANRFIELFTTGEKNEHKGSEWYMVYKEFYTYVKENDISVELPEKNLKAGDFFDYVLNAQKDYKSYPIYCENAELVPAAISRMTEGVDITERIKLLKEDERYNFEELLATARKMIEEETATDENIEIVLKMCKVLSDSPLKFNVTRAYLDKLAHEGEVLYDLQMLRALAGKEISGENDSYYAEMAKSAYYYDDTYDIWDKTRSYGTQVMAKVMGWLIVSNKRFGKPDGMKDVLTEMADIESRTGVERNLLIKFVNDWGKKSLTDSEKKVTLSNTWGSENWCKALGEESCPLSKSILDKYYQDFNAQPLTSFVDGNNSWVAQNTSYWLRVLNILIDGADFKQACSEKLIEITKHLIEGISTGHITNGNLELQEKLLSWAKFDDVSTKVNEMMGKFGNGQLAINSFKFKSLHHYMEMTRGYETQYLNSVIKPIIGDAEVRGIITGAVECYESLLHNNLDQASDLKKELIKLHGSSSNEEFKALIERLDILPKENSGDGSGEE